MFAIQLFGAGPSNRNFALLPTPHYYKPSTSTHFPITSPVRDMAPPVKCHECGRILQNLAALEQHAKDKAHKYMPAYFCPLEVCDERFESRTKRDKHVTSKRHHIQPETSTSSEAGEHDCVSGTEGGNSTLSPSLKAPSYAITNMGGHQARSRPVCP